MTEKEKENRNSGRLRVGDKPFVNYVTSAKFQLKEVKEITIEARGKFISRAVDIAEVLRNKFLKDKVELVNVVIGSSQFKNKEGKDVTVSSIGITLKNK